MKRKLFLGLGAAVGIMAGAYATFTGTADAQASYQWPTEVGCTSETQTCASGVCSRAIPDGGSGVDAGISMENVRNYTVRICGTPARPLAGTGSLKNYDCLPGSGFCAEVPANAQSVTTTTPCQESTGFVVPASLAASHRMVWAAASVGITNWDAGAADVVTVTVCPSL